MDRFIASIILAVGICMLIVPLWILYLVHGMAARLGIITAFIFFFVGLLSFATRATPFESLAAAAA